MFLKDGCRGIIFIFSKTCNFSLPHTNTGNLTRSGSTHFLSRFLLHIYILASYKQYIEVELFFPDPTVLPANAFSVSGIACETSKRRGMRTI